MEQRIETPYGTVTFKNDCPPERVQKILAEYAYKIGFMKGEKEDAA